METDYIFAYDANMNRSEVRAWLEANGHDSSLIFNMSPAKLKDYDYVWNHYSRSLGGAKANIERKEGSEVYGLILEIEQKLLKVFDRREGNPAIYSRGEQRLPVERLEDGKTIFAWVYIGAANRSPNGVMLPARSYKNILKQAAEFWKFPPPVIDKIKGWDFVL